MPIEEVHRYLWGLVDDRHRCHFTISDLAERYNVGRMVMHQAVLSMRESGRIKWVKCEFHKVYIYEIANPNTYDPARAGAHLARPTEPAWG